MSRYKSKYYQDTGSLMSDLSIENRKLKERVKELESEINESFIEANKIRPSLSKLEYDIEVAKLLSTGVIQTVAMFNSKEYEIILEGECLRIQKRDKGMNEGEPQ